MFSNQVIIVSFALLITASTSSAFSPSKKQFTKTTTTQIHYVSPQDLADVTSIIKIKHDTITNAMGAIMKKATSAPHHAVINAATTKVASDVEVQILTDSSHALMDFPSLFIGKKGSNTTFAVTSLRMQYAQFVGRLLWISCGLVPNHGFHPEELIIQLILLGVNIRPIIRSMILLKCINSNDKSNCTEECELEFAELESAFALHHQIGNGTETGTDFNDDDHPREHLA
jgi:hypothetical protein